MVKFNEKEVRFVIKFFIIFIAAEILINTLNFSVLENYIAASQARILGLDSINNLVFLQNNTVEIVSSCTGIVSGAILAAIIFSLKKPDMKKKWMIFSAGFFILLLVNYFRVLLVIWTGKEFGIMASEITHVLSWFITTAVIILMWFYFTKKITGTKNFAGFL